MKKLRMTTVALFAASAIFAGKAENEKKVTKVRVNVDLDEVVTLKNKIKAYSPPKNVKKIKRRYVFAYRQALPPSGCEVGRSVLVKIFFIISKMILSFFLCDFVSLWHYFDFNVPKYGAVLSPS